MECSLNSMKTPESIKNYVERAKIFFLANSIPEDTGCCIPHLHRGQNLRPVPCWLQFHCSMLHWWISTLVRSISNQSRISSVSDFTFFRETNSGAERDTTFKVGGLIFFLYKSCGLGVGGGCAKSIHNAEGS